MAHEKLTKPTRYRKMANNFQAFPGYAEMLSAKGATRLTITCWHGHQVAHITKYGNNPFLFLPLYRIGDIFNKEAQRLANQAAKRIEQASKATATPLELSKWLRELNGNPQPPKPGPDYSPLARITPDGKGLAWACVACFKETPAKRTRRTQARRHTGRLKLWNLAAIAAGLIKGQQETVIGATERAKRLAIDKYDALNPVQARRATEIMASLSQYATSQEIYARWGKDNFVIGNMR